MFYVYILTNHSNNLFYVGFTNDVARRSEEHKLKARSTAYTARYNINKLVYFEEFADADEARARERQLKKWRRTFKSNLITKFNPNWDDLSVQFLGD